MKKLYVIKNPYRLADAQDYLNENNQSVVSARTVVTEDNIGMFYLVTNKFGIGRIYHKPQLLVDRHEFGKEIVVSDAGYKHFETMLSVEMTEKWLPKVQECAKQTAYFEINGQPEVLDFSEEDVDDHIIGMFLKGWEPYQINEEFGIKRMFEFDDELPF